MNAYIHHVRPTCLTMMMVMVMVMMPSCPLCHYSLHANATGMVKLILGPSHCTYHTCPREPCLWTLLGMVGGACFRTVGATTTTTTTTGAKCMLLFVLFTFFSIYIFFNVAQLNPPLGNQVTFAIYIYIYITWDAMRCEM